MGWRFIWHLTIERYRDPDGGDEPRALGRWATALGVGLAAVGIASVIVWKVLH